MGSNWQRLPSYFFDLYQINNLITHNWLKVYLHWLTKKVCQIHWIEDLLLPEHKFFINLRFELVTSSVTFPASSASLLSSVPSCLKSSSRFIIIAFGTSPVPHRTWKLSKPETALRIAAFINHLGSFFCSFSILFLFYSVVIVGDLFSCSKEGLCQASVNGVFFPLQLISV